MRMRRKSLMKMKMTIDIIKGWVVFRAVSVVSL
jgi:hypothetical protein